MNGQLITLSWLQNISKSDDLNAKSLYSRTWLRPMRKTKNFRYLAFFSVLMVLLVLNSFTAGYNLQPVNHDQQLQHDHLNPEIPNILLLVLVSKSNHEITIANGRIRDQEGDRQQQIAKLTGKTMDIYRLLMEQQDDFGVREIQRYFGYSSPNLAAYHLNKLLNLDLVTKSDSNQYRINPDSQPVGPFQKKMLLFGSWIHRNTIGGLTAIVLALIGSLLCILHVPAVIWQVMSISDLIIGGILLLRADN